MANDGRVFDGAVSDGSADRDVADGGVTDSGASDGAVEAADAAVEIDASGEVDRDAGGNVACRAEWFRVDGGPLTLCPGAGDAGCPPISMLAGYQWVEGDVVLQAERNEDLAPLSCLEWSNQLTIRNATELTSLAGLSRLAISSGLVLNGTPKLTSLAGLGALTTLGYLKLQSNVALTGVEGLGTGVEIGSLMVRDNGALRSLSGLVSAGAVVTNSLYISGNALLPQCETERIVAPYPAPIKSVESNLGGSCP